MSEDPFAFITDNKSEPDPAPRETSSNSPLSPSQKKFIDDNYQILDLLALTRATFKDDALDGRTKEGKMVKAYVASLGKRVTTTERKRREKITLSDDDQEFILNHAGKMRPVEIAQELFDNSKLHQLSKEAMTVQRFIQEQSPDLLKGVDIFTEDEYLPPKNFNTAIKKINEACSENLDPAKMVTREKKCIEQLMRYLRAPRFVFTINNFASVLERQTFESEFIKTTWNKTDLTADEINLYINVINEYIIQNRILKILEKLNRALENQTDDDNESVKISMSLSDAIKGKNDEYHKSVQRQEGLVKQLEGERSKRINKLGGKNISIATLVEIFREEEERKNLLRIAEERKKLIQSEAKRLEGLDDTIARVFGIGIDEL